MKMCGRCKLEKPLSDFWRRGDLHQSYCKSCKKNEKREWIQKNRDKTKTNRLWSKYRLRAEDIQKILEKQNNLCALCKTPFLGTPHVDHDHSCCAGAKSCGKCVRGLLCTKCNVSLAGYEYISSLLNTAQYLDQSPSG